MNNTDLGKSPAFPRNPFRDDRGSWSESSTHEGAQGMDLRTYIATQAMKGLRSGIAIVSDGWSSERIAKQAVIDADNLIAELSKNT